MKKGLIGVQMSTVKEKIPELGVYEVLKRCADLGYHCVEISQIPMTKENVAEIKRACEDHHIKIAALTTSLEPRLPGIPGEYLISDFDKIVSDCKALDCSLLRIGMLPMTCMTEKEKAIDFALRTEEMAERLKEQGIDLYYHNHNVEFQKFDGEYLLDTMREKTKTLGFELDIHWIYRGGADPASYIRKFKGRVRLLHLKDYKTGKIVIPEGPLNPQSIMTALANVTEFAEVGEGSLNIKDCIEAGLESGSEYFLIEQDFTYGKDPFACLKTSRDNLVNMGYGDWF